MNLAYRLNSIQMIDPWIKTNFVHDHDTSFLGSGVKLPLCWRDVACSDDVSLSFNSSLNDVGMICVRNEGDNQLMLRNFRLKSGGVASI